jgi:glycosyltransferase involved in cell wall biosynthesis
VTLRLLWGSPLPPTRSGVADHAVDLLPELARRAQVRVMVPSGQEPPSSGPLAALPFVAADSPQVEGELQLLHLGNNPYHEWLLGRLALPRSVVVAHDLVLHHLLVESTLARGDWEGFAAGLVSAHGVAGAALVASRRYGLTARRDPFLFPARQPFLGHALAVVVHSDWARREVEGDLPNVPVLRVGLAVADPGRVGRRATRARLGLPTDATVLMHLGFLTPEKGLLEILTALAAAVSAGVRARLVLVGEGRIEGELRAVIATLGLGSVVSATGWVAAEELPRLPAAADLGVVLRTPSAGETSAAAVRFLACGTPVAVGGSAQFLEWSEAAAPRLTPGPAAAAELARLVVRVATERNRPAWRTRRQAARRAYEEQHRPAAVAAALVALLEPLACSV